ncbi:hypothetical protein BBJ29_005831 [Phytophthora kernoviae]|uniref:Protein kinase domain-containing protein n=1 Tax=Phytophthora kernoviae TaxID=325452 RepID=A0A3F2RN94_9STRA|nr:hypothetical protein BBP00_00005902 [Phytophthora kernoviae]RLN61220.1 hypothetical protein BBJ29_005831 [Phytophthora kernoviae]
MTATLVCNRSSNDRRTSATSSRSNAHRQIKVSSRLAPQIYLGHISRSSPSSGGPNLDVARPVVVKCAGKLQRNQDGRLQGPWKEWQAARQLRSVNKSHPNVVQVFDTFVQRSHVFLVMEHCARGDLLADLMATQPESRLEQRHALRTVLDLARGLQFLHETCNIAHRDVSLENVFVTHDGLYKLGDFGLSTKADTRASGCVGKTQYVAPEVVSETNYDPFASPRNPEFESVKAMGCCGVLKSWKMDSLLSSTTMDLLSKMLEFDPTKRLQTMREVLDHPALLAASSQLDIQRAK